MAVTKTLTKAIPFVKSGKVVKWDLSMTYENDSEGDATYYTSTFNKERVSDNGDFTAKAKADWTKAQLEALCPTSKWDVVFASQVDSVITNPVVTPVADTEYSIPS
tara:strand:- start:336 stop:653 length:318 start_codon:yes stop_codon:yes gene_type:complete